MPLAASDLVIRYTVTSGSAGDSTVGTAAGSFGKYASTTVAAAGLNGLFDDVSAAENTASVPEYRALAILNNNATVTAFNVVIYLAAEVAGGTSIALAVDNVAASAKGSASAQGATIASETATPSPVGAFSSPTTAATGISVGTLTPGQVRLIWVKRTPANSTSIDADGFTLGVQGE
jgi:hypothetical protein